MKPRAQSEISPAKKKTVAELIDLIKNKKTILLASIKNIPASQFQIIGKKVRGKAIIKVPKKNLISMAIDKSGNEETKKLKEHIGDSVAILFSDMDSYDLAAELIKSKSPAKAKPGQEAPEDIEIEAGPTELLPGPAISELGALGIQVQIEKGKIHIKAPKVIAKKGQKISAGAADMMSKLDIKPFTIGFEPIAAFDVKEGKLYLELKIDREGAVNDLRYDFGKALALAVRLGYSTEDTIKLLIGKAASHERRLIKVMGGEPDEAPVEAEVEKAPAQEEKKEEKAPAAEGLGALFG